MGKLERNEKVDILRGIAMLMVVLGHTMTGSTVGSENTFLFNVIWSLQMPLFMLISGYVNRYSRGVKSLPSFIGKKTFAYLFPWAVWTFIIRGVVFGQANFLNIKWLLWNMDSGYWFLFSIWTITMIFGVSVFLGKKYGNTEAMETVITAAVYIVGMGGLAAIGLIAGLSFLCIKLTLYYMPFYFLGYLFGKFQEKLEKWSAWDRLKDAGVAVSALIWLAILMRVNLYTTNEDLIGITERAITSLLGCVTICGLTPSTKYPKVGMAQLGSGQSIAGEIDELSSLKSIEPGSSTGDKCTKKNNTDDCKLYRDDGLSNVDSQANVSKSIVKKRPVRKVISWFGVNSLEVYILHGFILNMLSAENMNAIWQWRGFMSCIGNYVVCLFSVLIIVEAMRKSKLLMLLFGRTCSMCRNTEGNDL